MTTKRMVYLVKSSTELGYGDVLWENLKIFTSLESAEKFARKVQDLIDADETTDEVEIETFILEG